MRKLPSGKLTCRSVQTYEKGEAGHKTNPAASRVMNRFAGYMLLKWKLESGEGTRLLVQGSVCWQLKPDPTITQASQAKLLAREIYGPQGTHATKAAQRRPYIVRF